jgi:hypothetical protein
MKTSICCITCFHLQITSLPSWVVAAEEQIHTHNQNGKYHNKLGANTCYEKIFTNQGSKLWTSVIHTSSTVQISVQVK